MTKGWKGAHTWEQKGAGTLMTNGGRVSQVMETRRNFFHEVGTRSGTNPWFIVTRLFHTHLSTWSFGELLNRAITFHVKASQKINIYLDVRKQCLIKEGCSGLDCRIPGPLFGILNAATAVPQST